MIYNATIYNDSWNTKKLYELGDFSRGKSKHRPRNDPKLFDNGEYPLVQTGDIKAATLYVSKHEAAYNEFGLSQSKLWPTGTLCITIAANIAETGILAYPMCFPDSIVGFTANQAETSEQFMHYIFTYIRQSIQNSVSGSIQDNINIEYLKSLDFKIPEKSYQDKIVSVLSGLDEKIELNSKICSELEDMAKTLYDYWFVQFDFPDENGEPYRTAGGEMVWNEQLKREIPKGWEAKNIQEVCAIVDCLHSKKPDLSFESENYYLLQLDNLVDMGLLDLSNKYYVSANDYAAWTSKIEVRCGDLVITNAGRVGDIARIPEGIICGIGRNMTAIRAVNVDPIFMYYFFASSDMKAQIKSNTDTGSFFGSLNVRGIKQLIMPIPSEKSEIMNRFIDIVRPIRENLEMVAQQSQELSKLRDWLLPMLMNGQARVE